MLFRVLMISVLLGSAILFDLSGGNLLLDLNHLTLLWLVIVTYGLTIIYGLLLSRVGRYIVPFAYFQLVLDLFSAVVVVSLTGRMESPFHFLFSLTVLNAAILLYRRGAVYISAVATALVVGLVTREVTGLWLPAPADVLQLRSLFLGGLTSISAVFLVALLAGHLAEQLRDAGVRLRYASEDLEALKALNEHVLTSIQSGLVSYAIDFNVIFFNPAAARITGISPESILYHSVLDLFPGLAGRNPSRPEERWEESYTRPDGQSRTLGMSLSLLVDGQGKHEGWILVFQDLSPIREMEATVRRSEHLAAIGKLAAGIAHEIRNPLASMSGSIQLLSRSLKVEPVQQKLMDIVQRETDRLEHLVSDFLRFAKPTSPTRRTFDLHFTLEDLSEVFKNAHPEHELQVDVQAPLHLVADEEQVRQVLWNLLNNAVDAMPGGGLVQICARVQGELIELTVQDQGVGIAPSVLKEIFDPFFTTKANGTGLGLALVQRIVEDHSGRLDVQSEPGVGSRFKVVLPAPPSDR